MHMAGSHSLLRAAFLLCSVALGAGPAAAQFGGTGGGMGGGMGGMGGMPGGGAGAPQAPRAVAPPPPRPIIMSGPRLEAGALL